MDDAYAERRSFVLVARLVSGGSRDKAGRGPSGFWGARRRRLEMRNLMLSVVCLALLGVCSELSAQMYFTNVQVQANWKLDPGFSTGNVPEKANKTLYWLQLDVDYDTVMPPNAKGRVMWLDDVTIKYDILLPVHKGAPVVVLSGKVTYWSIPMDGKTHHAQAFVHPRFIQRYAPELKQRNRELKDFRIVVTFEFNGSGVGGGVVKLRSNTKPQDIVAQLRKALGFASTRKIQNSIFPRNETPWGIINLSNYELIKRK